MKRQDLREAMEILASGKSTFDEKAIPSMGCSIKWKELTAAALERKKK
jgi:hypothetical protein